MNPVIINGVNIYPFSSKSELVNFIEKNKGILVAINAGKINRATDETRKIINRNIGYADGLGAVASLKKKGCKNVVKIAGCDLWLDLVKRNYKDKTFYLIGGDDKIINTTVNKLKDEFKGIHILGYRNGFFNSENEKEDLIKEIEEKKPDIVFVAMGSPKQELLMEEMQEHHNAIYQGLGGSFKVYCGFDKRAPEWLIKRNLEGPYRFLSRLNEKAIYHRFFNDLFFFIKLYTNRIK